MKDILQQRYNVSTLIIGYDHRFGHNRSEGFEDYVRYGQQIGMNVYRAQACMIDDLNISSSLVRTHLLEGKIDLSTRYLGYNYSIEGVVVGVSGLCTEMGLPFITFRPFHVVNTAVANAFIEVAARAQKWVDQAISRNMYLETRDVDEYEKIYMQAWKHGLKTSLLS